MRSGSLDGQKPWSVIYINLFPENAIFAPDKYLYLQQDHQPVFNEQRL